MPSLIDRNADALFRQYLQSMITTPVPQSVLQSVPVQQSQVFQMFISALPLHSASDIRSLQWGDPDV